MEELLQWNFTQIVVGHGEPIQNDAKEMMEEAIRERGFRIGKRA